MVITLPRARETPLSESSVFSGERSEFYLGHRGLSVPEYPRGVHWE